MSGATALSKTLQMGLQGSALDLAFTSRRAFRISRRMRNISVKRHQFKRRRCGGKLRRQTRRLRRQENTNLWTATVTISNATLLVAGIVDGVVYYNRQHA